MKMPSSAVENVVWDRDILLGPGGPHDPDMLARLSKNPEREVAGNGTVDEPRIIWLSRPPRNGVDELEKVIMQEASKCLQSYVWIM